MRSSGCFCPTSVTCDSDSEQVLLWNNEFPSLLSACQPAPWQHKMINRWRQGHLEGQVEEGSSKAPCIWSILLHLYQLFYVLVFLYHAWVGTPCCCWRELVLLAELGVYLYRCGDIAMVWQCYNLTFLVPFRIAPTKPIPAMHHYVTQPNSAVVLCALR